MRIRLRIILISVIAMVLFGCTSKQSLYSVPLFKHDVTGEIEELVVLPDYNYVHNLENYGTYLVLVAFNSRNGNYLHLIDKATGAIVSDFVRQGRGPGEIQSVPEVSLVGNQAFIYDMSRGTTEVYNMERILSLAEFGYEDEIGPIERPFPASIMYSDGLRVITNNDSYLASDPSMVIRMELDNKAGHSLYDSYPIEDREKTWMMYNQPHMTISPDKTMMAVAPAYGGILERFDIRDQLKLMGVDYMIEPDFTVEKGNIVFSPNYKYGFSSLASSNQRVFAGMVDPDIPDKQVKDQNLPRFRYLVEFDWKGRPVKRTKFDVSIQAMALDEAAGYLYVVYRDVPDRINHLGRIRIN